MKSEKLIVFGLVCLLAACSVTPEVEMPVRECAAPPEGRACVTCFAADNTVFIIGGRTYAGSFCTTMLCYDIPSNTWTQAEQAISPRVNGTACVTSHGVFVGLGYYGSSYFEDENHLRDWWLFNPQQRTWRQLADFPTDKTVAAVCWSDEQYVWVSSGFNGFTEDIWRYDIANDTWSASPAKSPLRVMSPVAATCQGRSFYGTGYRRESKSDWYEWRDEGLWARRASVPGKGRMNAACAATDHYVWIVGGWHYGDSLTTGFHYADIVRYAPADDQWTRCGVIPCGETENGAACAWGRTLFFGLGEDKNATLHAHWYALDE